MKRDVHIHEILYPKFNTLRLDSDDLDGNPYQDGLNRLGPRIKQKRWDMERDCDDPKVYWIEPGERMVVQKQEQFYALIFQFPEVFFGGARGDGKTYALLLSHVVKHLSWKARGIIGQTSAMFTESKVQLKERHLVLLPQIFPSWLGKMEGDELFRFYPKFGGGAIMFLYIGNRKNEIERILSYNLAYITVDELTRQSEHSYLFINSCLRSSVVPASEWCVASASNPGSKGHKWVNRRFVKLKERKKAFELRGERRGFIKALPEDNPLLPPSYWREQLMKMSAKNIRAFRHGDWSVFEGQYFDMLDEEVHFIPANVRIPDEVVKHVGIDFGTNHPSGCVWLAHFQPSDEYPDGRFVVYRYFEKKDKYPNRIKSDLWQRMKHDKNIISKVLSHDAFSNRQSTEGYLTVSQRFNTRDKWGPDFGCVSSRKGNDVRTSDWRLLLSLLFFESHVEKELVNGAEIPVLKIDHPPQLYFKDTPDCRMLFEELQAMQHKDGDSEDCEKQCGSEYEVGEGDEGPDALRYALQGIEIGEMIQAPEEEEPEEYDPLRDMEDWDDPVEVGYATFTI